MPQRRVLLRRVALYSLAVSFAGFLAWVPFTDLDSSAAVASVVGLLAALAALAVAVVQAFPVEPAPKDTTGLARRLARDVRAQWIGEAEARWLRNEQTRAPVLPLEWTVTAREVGAGAGHRLRSPSGRLAGRFDEAAASLAAVYRDIGSGRLIMLGEPGSGKTVLAMLLAVGLLPESRFWDGAPPPTAEDPVPVLLSASSWDPISETMEDWIVRSLALSYFGDTPEAPRDLLRAGLLLPIVDGLDEIPEAARRSAVHAIIHTVGPAGRVVVTCRAVEYEDTIRGGAPALHEAPVIEVSPVSAVDAIGYLRTANTSASDVWEKVYDALEQKGALAEALRTPLMIAMASTVHGGPDGDPSPLLDTGAITCRHDAEDHLLDRVVAAEFRDDRRRPWQPAVAASPWDAEQVERWLVFLAEYLHRHRERDIAWWRLSERLLSRWAIPVITLVAGTALLAVTLAYGGLAAALAPRAFPQDLVLGIGACFGGGFAVLAMLTWYAAPARPPGRSPSSLRGSLPRFRGGIAAGLMVAAIPAVPGFIGWAVAVTVFDDWDFGMGQTFISAIAMVLGVSVLLGLAVGCDAVLSAPSELSEKPSPARFLRDDRGSALRGAAATAGVIATGLLPVVFAAATLSAGGGSALLRWLSGEPEPDGLATPAFGWSDFSSAEDNLAWGYVFVFPAITIGLLVLLTHAWPRYLAVRLVLALRRQLPWDLPRFLAYARDRGLLRESGGMYQFRHVRLQERLAGRPAEATPPPDEEALARRRRLRIAVAGVAAAAMLGATVTVLHQPATALVIRLDRPRSWAPDQTVSLNRDGTVLALGEGRRVDVWDLDLDAAKGVPRAPIVLPDDLDAITAVAVSPDGERLAIAVTNDYHRSATRSPHAVRLLDRIGRTLSRWDVDREIDSLSFGDGDARLAAADAFGGISVLPAGATAERLGPAASPTDKNPSPVVTMVGSSGVAARRVPDESVVSYGDTRLPRTVRTLHGDAGISAIAVSPDQSVVVTGSNEGTLRFHPAGAVTESLHVTSSRLSRVAALAVRDNDARYVVATDGDDVELWTVS
ncbi:hypothetical protein [Actinoplanes sp. NPDC051851]|uniref:hypothetical protein n=1 Tax=Actinoplanes sp. NPDC051851 TaxID=3154753 RepID=UPI00342B614A